MQDAAYAVLHLEAVPPRPGECPPPRRLARLLKAMLRSYGFRCRKIDWPATPAVPQRRVS